MANLSAEARERIAAEAAEIRRRVMDPNYEKPKAPPRSQNPYISPTGLSRGANLRGPVRYTGRKYNSKEIVEMFDSGLRAVDIAKKLEAPHSSIRDVLLRNGRTIDGKGGAPVKEKCKNGHNEWRQIYKNGVKNGRYCVPCKLDAGRRRYARKSTEKETE